MQTRKVHNTETNVILRMAADVGRKGNSKCTLESREDLIRSGGSGRQTRPRQTAVAVQKGVCEEL